MRIDLHTHSTASDGTESPAEVMAAAAAADLDVVALTDHDTVAGWAEAGEAAERLGIDLVRGMELSCQTRGRSVHLLSYLHDPGDPGLVAEMARTREDRLSRAQRMVDRIAADYPLTMAEVLDHTPDGATIGRPHIADAMIAAGHFPDRDAAFATVLSSRSPYHVPHYAPSVQEAVVLVRGAGGVPVLAHPWAARQGRRLSAELIAELTGLGLAGLEVDHRDHDAEARQELRELAHRFGLLITGSSDYHGSGKQNRIGENLTEPDVLDAIRAQAGKS